MEFDFLVLERIRRQRPVRKFGEVRIRAFGILEVRARADEMRSGVESGGGAQMSNRVVNKPGALKLELYGDGN